MTTSPEAFRELIHLPTRVDMAIFPFLKKDLKQKIRPGATLVLDMTQTRFVEPAMLLVFWDSLIESQHKGAKIVVQGMNAQVRVVFELAGLLPHFQ